MNALNQQLSRREFLARTAAFAGMGATLAPLIANAGEAARPRDSRVSYYCNGEIHVGVPGRPEEKPLTTGHWDFKPSWSKTGNMLVFFRRLKNDPNVGKWITATCIINVDGTGFYQLSDGTYTDFNPTWTRDGRNTPLWNRKNAATGGYCIMAGKVGGKPGEEVALTDKRYSSWVHSAVSDGRLLVASAPPKLGRGYYLMTPNTGGELKFEPIECEMAKKGVLDRVSVSPSEKKICFEYQKGFKHSMIGRTLYIAEFDVQKRTITNAKPFANEAGKPFWFAYPRWIDGEAAVVYHSGETGKNQLYVYRLDDASTKRVSINATADYRYPHGEAAPC
ncbi:MAG: PD40 domain-containing protein [Verrucomicrobia bacterium]|nr:PD40 domain-containing protein [Verrucomicrobiota bacterium]